MSRQFLLGLLLLLPVLLRADDYASPDLGITFPHSLAGMDLVKVTDYEKQEPGLGVGLSYRTEKEKADFYIYTAGVEKIPDGIDSKMIQNHFKQVTGDVFEMEKREVYQDVKVVVPTEKIILGQTPFLHTEIHYIQGEARISHIYMAAFKNRFLKIRYTYYASEPVKGKKALDDLLKSTGEILSKVTP